MQRGGLVFMDSLLNLQLIRIFTTYSMKKKTIFVILLIIFKFQGNISAQQYITPLSLFKSAGGHDLINTFGNIYPVAYYGGHDIRITNNTFSYVGKTSVPKVIYRQYFDLVSNTWKDTLKKQTIKWNKNGLPESWIVYTKDYNGNDSPYRYIFTKFIKTPFDITDGQFLVRNILPTSLLIQKRSKNIWRNFSTDSCSLDTSSRFLFFDSKKWVGNSLKNSTRSSFSYDKHTNLNFATNEVYKNGKWDTLQSVKDSFDYDNSGRVIGFRRHVLDTAMKQFISNMQQIYTLDSIGELKTCLSLQGYDFHRSLGGYYSFGIVDSSYFYSWFQFNSNLQLPDSRDLEYFGGEYYISRNNYITSSDGNHPRGTKIYSVTGDLSLDSLRLERHYQDVSQTSSQPDNYTFIDSFYPNHYLKTRYYKDKVSGLNLQYISYLKFDSAGHVRMNLFLGGQKYLRDVFEDTAYAVYSGIEEENQISALSFDVFPNPSHSTFNIKLETSENKSASLEISDMLGKLIITFMIASNDKDKVIDISNLPQGVYILKLSDGGKQGVKKIIKY